MMDGRHEENVTLILVLNNVNAILILLGRDQK